jgi:3-oxoacyl-[acyl-carrier protein] reductase
MDLELAGKRALVTGSSAGIGEAIAKALAGEAAVVAVHGRDAASVEGVLADIHAGGGDAHGVHGDLQSDAEVAALAERVTDTLGGVDILVNNAGIYANTTWANSTSDGWRAAYQVNVVSATELIRRLVPGMRERGWGRVIQISSGEATNPFPTMPDYAATKAALVNLTVSLAKDLDRTGVTANTISPGLIVTPGVETFFREVAAERGWGEDWTDIEARVLREVLDNPTGRLGRPDDVAIVAAFLSSPRAGYVNGANYRVDGGSTAVIN